MLWVQVQNPLKPLKSIVKNIQPLINLDKYSDFPYKYAHNLTPNLHHFHIIFISSSYIYIYPLICRLKKNPEKMKCFSIVFIILIVLVLHFHHGKAARMLHGGKEVILLESLQKGDVPPSGPSGCTQIPGGSGGSGGCPINEMHFAGAGAAPAHRRLTVPAFGVAIDKKEAR